jgi:RNA polymerase sigma factor (sigma-70 family)
VTTNRLALVLQNLRRSALLRDGAAQTDGQLLEAFLRDRDGLALEALVRRHAPMVWGICRRALAHHDAEDAFQATFLVLVRKAASIRSRELLPNWLYRVACLTARKARQRAAKRYAREKQVRVMPEPPMGAQDGALKAELSALLDEELSRLPEKFRIAVVLCDVQGRTRHDAAQQLGLPEGTVASRLRRGRALLAKRLLRRGLSVSATALAAAGFQQAVSGAVPAALLTHTGTAVSLLAAGKAVPAGLFSPEVGPLAEGVLHALTAAKLKTAGVLLVLAALVLAGGLAARHTLTALVPAGRTATAHAPAPRQAPLRRPSEPPGEVRRFTVEQWAWSVSFSPNGRQILIGVGGSAAPVRVCDVGSGQEVLRTTPYPSCWSTAYSPDGKFIAVGSMVKPIEILDAGTGQLLRKLEANAGRVRNVVFSPDSRLIASSHQDGRLRVWDIAREKVLHTFPADNNAVHSAAFTPDGNYLLVIDHDATLRLYEAGSGQEVRKLEGHTERVTDVAVSADGARALSCSFDKTLRLWDLQTGKELRRLVGHDAGVHGVAFCPDGRRALSGSYDKTLRLWDVRTGRQLHRFDSHQGVVCCVAVSPDGRYALSGSSDQTVRLWRLPAPAPAPQPGG